MGERTNPQNEIERLKEQLRVETACREAWQVDGSDMQRELVAAVRRAAEAERERDEARQRAQDAAELNAMLGNEDAKARLVLRLTGERDALAEQLNAAEEVLAAVKKERDREREWHKRYADKADALAERVAALEGTLREVETHPAEAHTDYEQGHKTHYSCRACVEKQDIARAAISAGEA